MLDRAQHDVTNLGTGLLVVITAIALYLCWAIVAPFVSVLTWTFALLLLLSPLRARLRHRLPDWATALLLVSLVIVVVLLVAAFLSHRLVQEAIKAGDTVRRFLQPAFWQRLVATQPWLAATWNAVSTRIDLAQITQQTSAAIAKSAAGVVGRSAIVLSRAAFSLFILFFLIRDQDALAAAIRRLLPLTPNEADAVWTRVSSAMRASVYGRILIGAVQGALGGVIFALLGLPAALFWAVVMAVLSMLPIVGAFVVWVPATIYLLLTGHWVQAIVLAVYGFGVIQTADNILYPFIVGPRSGLHPVVLLIALVGGLVAFGAAGLVLGPAIIAFALALIDVWSERLVTAPAES